MIFWLIATAAQSAAAGLDWVVFEPEGAWSERQRGLVYEAASAIPEGVSEGFGAIRFVRVSDLPAHGSQPRAHAIAVTRGPRAISVALGSPDSPVPEENAIIRGVLHALSHHVDTRLGLSADRRWREISGWDWPPGTPPAEHARVAFAEPGGRRSAAEDLATTLERFFTPRRLADDIPLEPACRMPSKWRYLLSRFPPPDDAQGGTCPPLARVGLDPALVDAIDIIYVRASARSPGSVLGHTLLGVRHRADRMGVVHESTYELAAVTSGTARNSLAYLWRGLTGGFDSRVRREPLRATVLRYAKENREVVRLRLSLSDEEKVALLERLDEMEQGWQRPYLFLARNCTQLPKEAVTAALSGPLPLPFVFGPDALVGAIDRTGRLAAVEKETIDEYSPGDRAAAAAALRAAAGRRLLEIRPTQRDWFAGVLDDASSADIARRVEAYRSMGARSADLVGDSVEAYHLAFRFLAWSDHVERARMVEAGRTDDQAADPAIEALWFALAATSQAATSGGRGPEPGDTGHAALMAALDSEDESHTSHTPLLQSRMEVAVESRAGGATGWLRASSALYRFRLGESRRYSVAPGLEGTLLSTQIAVGAPVGPAASPVQEVGSPDAPSDGEPSLRAEGSRFRILRMGGGTAMLSPGYSLAVLRARFSNAPDERSWIEPLAVGGAMQLLGTEQRRAHLTLTAGAALQFSAPDGERTGEWLATATTPVILFGRVGSKTQALTGMDATVAIAPFWNASGAATEFRAEAGGQLHLGELAKTDVALSASYAVELHTLEDEFSTHAGHRFSLGVWLEPY